MTQSAFRPRSSVVCPISSEGSELHQLAKQNAGAVDTANLRERIDALGPWFHNIDLGGGVMTAPEHFLGDYPTFKFKGFAHVIPENLKGKTVLDIGCNAGFYSVEMRRRGAA